MKPILKLVFIFSFILSSMVAFIPNAVATPLAQKEVPEPLKPWVGWVLYEQDENMCPHAYNSKQRFCAWPSGLKLALDNKQGTFSQHWQVQSESWVRLPGNSQQWPHDVEVDSLTAVVVNRQGFPSVKLLAGEHEVSGRFQWDNLPESLTIPPETGVLEISRNGERIEFPRINQQGQLWLDKSIQQKDVQDAMDVQIYRKINDGHPMQIETRFILNVSGHSRDVVFPHIQLEGFTALKLNSQLPARINQQGDLQVQVRPGNWQVNLVSYSSKIVDKLTAVEATGDLPQQEVWVFQANPSLRLTEISGVASIDSRQTRLPNEWQQYPSYLLEPKQSLILKTLQRGSASPEPNQLTLNRTMWMDFEGDGFTIADGISGTMTKGWRLVTAPELELGSVRIDGKPQFITTLKSTSNKGDNKSENKGVEVRRGQINLQAESRYTQSVTTVPVTGWQHDFQRVSTRLFLPPGWKLLSAHGADNLPNTWLQRWTLLDLFMVLIIAVAIGRLWGWKWGGFALLTMVLIWHEPGAPKYIWLNLIAAIALLRVLPKGLVRKLVWGYRNAVFLGLMLIIIPFIVTEVRHGLYPQLGIYADYDQPVYDTFSNGATSRGATLNSSLIEEMSMDSVSSVQYDKFEKRLRKPAAIRQAPSKEYSKKNQMANQMVDPNANIQTGPGLPTWNWQEVNFEWNSPVNEEQTLRLNLLSPKVNLVLNFLRVILLLLLIGRLIRVFTHNQNGGSGDSGGSHGAKRKKPLHRFSKSIANSLANGLVILVLPLIAVMAMSDANADELAQPKVKHLVSGANANAFPNEVMLEKLKRRLLSADNCLPRCAQIESLRLELNEQQLTLYVKIHSAVANGKRVAVPLPGNTEQWRPDTVLLSNEPATSLSRDNQGVLWIGLTEGIHHVVMQGRLPNQSQLQLSLPLLPKYVDWQGEGWTVEGIRDNHIPSQQLQLIRTQSKSSESSSLNAKAEISDNHILPPLLQVQRTLHLGLDWMVETQVLRLSPTGVPISMKIPLLKNESVLSSTYPVKKGHVLINMSSTQRSISWNSQISVSDSLLLEATNTTGLVESWKLDISPIWHVEITGIPEIHHAKKSDEWLPEWQPWPGEKVTLAISRPQGIAGRTLTIDRSILTVKVGKRIRESELSLNVRSSRGGQHIITLPEHAELASVSINGSMQPIRQQGRKVSLPIIPGTQRIVAKWRVDTTISSRLDVLPVDVGVDNVNNSIRIRMGRDRWVLFTNGPQMGPAVLFWGVLLVVLIGSVIVGRMKESPLKTWQWFLLGTGLILATPIMIIIVAGWLLAMNYRPKLQYVESRLLFNGGQVLLVLLTLVALATLVFALRQGLLGWPDMQISGNSSSAWELRWFQDRASAQLPQPWIISVPLLVYRLLMLLWALWLAFSLISWLRNGWHNFTVGGLWREGEKKVKADKNIGKGEKSEKAIEPKPSE